VKHADLSRFWLTAPVDNDATHKHAVVRAWLEKHSHVHVHFTPTGFSWLNLVERFFRQLTDDVVREGSCASVARPGQRHRLPPYAPQPQANAKSLESARVVIFDKIHRARKAQAKVVLECY